MQPEIGVQGTIQSIITSDQIQRRVADIARQVSQDYRGKMLYAVCVLEDGFIFMADLVRHLELPVVCQFIKPESYEIHRGEISTTEILFSPEVDVKGGEVLLIQGLLESGITTEFLMRNLAARGAVSVKVATLLDRQTGRRVSLQPDYFGFLVDESFVFGYGLGSPQFGRNLPFLATTREATAQKKSK